MRVRSLDVTENGPDEITTTVNISRIGILIETSSTGFFRQHAGGGCPALHKNARHSAGGQEGHVVRVSELPDGRRSVAVALGLGVGDLINTAGHKLHLEPEPKPAQQPAQAEPPALEVPKFALERSSESTKPLVLTLDADSAMRDSIKDYLTEKATT